VIAFPNCKINLGLHILARRTDDYHDLETAFIPITFEDCLEIQRSTSESSLIVSGLTIEGPAEDNLCWKAYQLLKQQFNLPPLDIRLQKQIPSGAGLGGGSSDAAFCLKLLNQKFNLNLDQQRLMEMAATLGSDCAFFILNTPCIGKGRGEQLMPIECSQLNNLFGLLVIPGIHISSRWAFQQIAPESSRISIQKVLGEPVQKWREQLVNDFEKPVFQFHPQLKQIKEQLYQAGAVYASMSGSGSALYGLFEKTPEITFDTSVMVKTFTLYNDEN
jgi:4-diphosphocytidyl-2-C-methyl-D-erythritol kinase